MNPSSYQTNAEKQHIEKTGAVQLKNIKISQQCGKEQNMLNKLV
jgi:hypothetical protein